MYWMWPLVLYEIIKQNRAEVITIGMEIVGKAFYSIH